MSVHAGSLARAPVGDAPKEAFETNSHRLTRGWSRAFLATLILVQVTWTAGLLYALYFVIGALGGLV